MAQGTGMEDKKQSEAFNGYIQTGFRHAKTTAEHSFGFFDTNIDKHFKSIYEDVEGEIRDSFDEFLSDMTRLVAIYAHIRHTHDDAFSIDLDGSSDEVRLCGCERRVLKNALELCETVLRVLNQRDAQKHTNEWVAPEESYRDQFDEWEQRTSNCRQRNHLRQQEPAPQSSQQQEEKIEQTFPRQPPAQQQIVEEQQQSINNLSSRIVDHVVWGNPPSLKFDGNVRADSFDNFWNSLCGNVFGKNIPRKFDVENIEKVEEEGQSILVAFVRRPKKFHLMRFVECVRDLDLDFRVFVCDTFDSPSKTNCSLSSFLYPSQEKRRVGFGAYNRQQPAAIPQQQARRRPSFSTVVSQSHQQPQQGRHNESSFSRPRRRLSFSTPRYDAPHYYGRRGYSYHSPMAYAIDDTQFGRREPAIHAAQESKLTDLERKLDNVMSFLMSRFGFG